MTDFSNFNRPHINKGIPSTGDGSKKGGNEAAAEEGQEQGSASPQYDAASPDSIFNALQAQGLSLQDAVTENRISQSLAGLPSVEDFSRFESMLDEELPGLNPLQKSEIAADYFAGRPVIGTA